MEGPSLVIAKEHLSYMINKKIIEVYGNTKIEKERMLGKKILDIFSFGKRLYFQFDTFALKTHFLLYGSYDATIKGLKVTGDYPRKERPVRLAILVKGAELRMFSCSVLFVEDSQVKKSCDFNVDIMSKEWDRKAAFKKIKSQGNLEVADVLLDQETFAGVGNIIKNEVLIRVKISPLTKIKSLSDAKIKKIITTTEEYVQNFYEWRKNFELKKHYLIYRQSFCKVCGNKVARKKTGIRNRISFICPNCQV